MVLYFYREVLWASQKFLHWQHFLHLFFYHRQIQSVVIYWNFKQGHGKYIWVSVSPLPHSYPWKTAPTDDRTSMEATTSGSQHPFPLSLGILHTEIPVTTTNRLQVTNKSKPLCYLWSTHQTLSILRWATCNLCIQDHYTLVSESERSLTCHPLLLYFLVWEIHGNNFYG